MTSALTRLLALLFAAASLAWLGGCAPEPAYRVYEPVTVAPERVEYGTVGAIEMYRDGESRPIGLGTVLGGVAGGILGHQIGSGSGQTAATIAGTLGGALVGRELERSSGGERYRIVVHMDSGGTLAVSEVGEGQLRVGDRVRIVGNRVYRV